MSHIDGALAGVDFFFSDAIMKKRGLARIS